MVLKTLTPTFSMKPFLLDTKSLGLKLYKWSFDFEDYFSFTRSETGHFILYELPERGWDLSVSVKALLVFWVGNPSLCGNVLRLVPHWLSLIPIISFNARTVSSHRYDPATYTFPFAAIRGQGQCHTQARNTDKSLQTCQGWEKRGKMERLSDWISLRRDGF